MYGEILLGAFLEKLEIQHEMIPEVFIKKETLKKHISCTFVWVTQEKFKLTCSCLKLISIFYLTLWKSSFQIHNVKWTSWKETEYNLHFLFRSISDISDQFFVYQFWRLNHEMVEYMYLLPYANIFSRNFHYFISTCFWLGFYRTDFEWI